MFVVTRLRLWKDVELEQIGLYRIPLPISLAAPEDGDIGYLPVFETREAALKYAGDESLISEIRSCQSDIRRSD